MGWAISTVALVWAGGIVTGVTGVRAVRRRADSFTISLTLFLGTITIWAIPYGFSFFAANLDQLLFFHRVRYLGTAFAPVTLLVVAIHYAGADEWLSPPVYALLSIVPVATVVAVLSNESHGLFWRSVAYEESRGIAFLLADHGPFYYGSIAYTSLLLLVALGVLTAVFARSGPINRMQTALMLVACALPLAMTLPVIALIPLGPVIDLPTTALAMTGVTLSLTLVHFDLLSVRPVARDQVFDELDDGVIVVDADGRVADANAEAESLLADVGLENVLESVVPRRLMSDGGELVVDGDGRERTFHVRSRNLTDDSSGADGCIVHLDEVTELIEREQRISVLNRVLQHNVRNELSLVIGYLDTVTDATTGNSREYLDDARQRALRIVELSEKARFLERTLEKGNDETIASATRVVERAVCESKRTYEEAEIELEFDFEPGRPPTAPVRVIDEALFERAVNNLVENAIVHNDAAVPVVRVTVESTTDRVRIHVADNGPGIPRNERRVIEGGTETSLKHGNGLGLWLAKWTVSLSNGRLSFAENGPRGSVVTLSLSAPAPVSSEFEQADPDPNRGPAERDR